MQYSYILIHLMENLNLIFPNYIKCSIKVQFLQKLFNISTIIAELKEEYGGINITRDRILLYGAVDILNPYSLQIYVVINTAKYNIYITRLLDWTYIYTQTSTQTIERVAFCFLWSECKTNESNSNGNKWGLNEGFQYWNVLQILHGFPASGNSTIYRTCVFSEPFAFGN